MENKQVDTGCRWAQNQGTTLPVIQSKDIADVTGMVSVPCDFCPFPLLYLRAPQAQKDECAGLGSAGAIPFFHLCHSTDELSVSLLSFGFMLFHFNPKGGANAVFLTISSGWTLVLDMRPTDASLLPCCITWCARAAALAKWTVAASPVGLRQEEGQ